MGVLKMNHNIQIQGSHVSGSCVAGRIMAFASTFFVGSDQRLVMRSIGPPEK
jgi:hypothetical protein